MAKAKGLNALKRIKQGKFVTCNVCDATMYKGCLCCAKQLAKCKDLVTIQKELKALDIIREKKVNTLTLLQCCYDIGKYNAKCSPLQSMLTLDEVNLLKEVLNND